MRPTRLGSARRGQVRLGMGFDPDEPIGEPEEPTDYLQDESAFAWYPVSGAGTTTLVQSATTTPGAGGAVNQNISFTNPVVGGNLLVALIATRSFSGTITGPAGWTDFQIDTNGFNSGDGALFYKVADGTEGTGPFTFNTGAGTDRSLAIAEFEGPNGFVDSASTTGTATASYNIGDVTPTASSPTTLIAGALNSDNITGVANFTTVSNLHAAGGINGPVALLAYRGVDPASGNYAATVTQTSQDIRGGVHLAFSDIADPAWIPAPLTIDDDDATYHEIVGHEECWRGQLQDAYQIGRARLVIGTETSGSKSYDLEGQTLDDIGAETGTVIGTFLWTATGSYTADTIEITTAGAAGYQFYRLVGPDENRYIYTVNLYSPTIATGAELDAHIFDATDAHDASAVSVVPFDTIAATNVQDALEEVLAEAGGAITVEDGTTSVSPVDTIVFDGATVTDDGGGQVTVEIEGGGGGGTPMTANETFITSNVTLTSADTYYDGPSVSLTAGTYLVWASLDVENTGAAWMTGRLWDGTNIFHETEGFIDTSGAAVALTVFAKITLTSTTTVKASVACHSTGGTLLDTTNFNGTADKSTKLSWLLLSTPGLAREFDYAQITSAVNPTATTEATANTVVTGNAVTYDGSTTVMVEFFAPSARPQATAGATLNFWLYDGSSSIGRIGAAVTPSAASTYEPVMVARSTTHAFGGGAYLLHPREHVIGHGQHPRGRGRRDERYARVHPHHRGRRGGPSGGTALLLTYALASDITNQALTGGSAFDIIANQNFTVAYSTSTIEVSVRGMAFCNDAVTNQYMVRVNIDSGGTPVLRYISGASNTNTSANNRDNPFGGSSPVFISGLSAGVHTVKVQIIATANDHFYCRASSNGPTTGAEFMQVQVVEHR